MSAVQEQLLDFASSNEQAGFRLHRIEVYNWGTFHQRVWSLAPGGENALLTGDIGSGKSTLVDAVTTLLVPAQRITYNKAAGAENRERTLKSYVLGYYKSTRGDEGLSARAVALRDHDSYSVILGHFYNQGYDQHVTLAQVFWTRDREGQPARFFVVADQALSIRQQFAEFGTDINHLRKRLRNLPGVELFDSFPPYGAAFRRRFGIDNEQALELFNQTVSLKSVGNLTDFVRQHMLEAFAVEPLIEALIGHFDDLNRAHEAVLKAKAQIEALEPLVADAERHTGLSAGVAELIACRGALPPWFAGLKAELLEQRLARLAQELARLDQHIATLEERKRGQFGHRDELKQAIAENGGDRLERIRAEVDQKQREKAERRNRAERYNALARQLDLPAATRAEIFLANRAALQAEQAAARDRQAQIQNVHTERSVDLRTLKTDHDRLQQELVSLRQRRSNIPSGMLAIRERLCAALALDEATLPFAGELIQVREQERDWEGAAERLLHNFGLSLLVPDAHYPPVAEWVDRTHLRGRLVYYRIRERREPGPVERHPQSLVRKLAIQPASEFYPWLEAELARRFDYACCSDLEQFRREQRAVTRSGQIKAGGERHEKDDRHRIDDRSRYVLGWSNEAKIAALEQQARNLEHRIQTVAGEIAELQSRRDALQERLGGLDKLDVFVDFRELDWHPLVADIERLEHEQRQLTTESDLLRTLQAQLAELDRALQATETELDRLKDSRSRTGEKHDQATALLGEARAVCAETTLPPHQAQRLRTLHTELAGGQRLTVEACDKQEKALRDGLQARIDAESKKIGRLRDSIIKAMEAYNTAYPLETREVDVAIESAPDYTAMLAALRSDDLPRFEARFKELLNENTIREVATFNARLHRERQSIRERIATINRSLHEIDYNPGRYIVLQAEPAPDAEIRDFQQSLRACTEGTTPGSEEAQYSEAKFLQVKAIIERFRGREGSTELDRRWTRKVTDVRNGFIFSASERWREDDSEYEHYTDSGGKSGGQKEKLAYTVLAASLAYQFGLEWGAIRSRSFRFVVIDEAFGRGSDESARYGLELFRRLNLQLLIVTPLQKIHIIEPFVASVGFVHNEDGKNSLLRNLTIEEYRAEKADRQAS